MNGFGSKIRTAWGTGIVGLLSITAAHGQLFVSNTESGTVGEYGAGNSANSSLVTGLNYDNAIAISGNDLYVSNNDFIGTEQTVISEYNATTGATIDETLVTGLSNPVGIVVSGSNLYTVNGNNGSVGEYDATTGTPINPTLIAGTGDQTISFALSGNAIYVPDYDTGTVLKYNATTGATISSSFISGLRYPVGIAVSGNDLFVVNRNTSIPGESSIAEYDATTGAAIDSDFLTGLDEGPSSIAVSNNELFVLNTKNGTISEYNATTGALINATFATGLNTGAYHGNSLALGGVAADLELIPEPSTWAMLAGGLCLLTIHHYKRKSSGRMA